MSCKSHESITLLRSADNSATLIEGILNKLFKPALKEGPHGNF